MGDFGVRAIENAKERNRMYRFAINDIHSFDHMLENNMFDAGPLMIGAEQELCLVDSQYSPSTQALNILDSIEDEKFTNELALFNLEINLDPIELSNDCFSVMEKRLLELMKLGYAKSHALDNDLLLTGILPTLKYRHLQFKYMTPIERYKTLSKSLSDIRGRKFDINLEGVDELIMSLDSVLFEACNTSFQLHLQIKSEEFVNQHNWSQMIAGPVLSACVNSPMLFGNELWAETRIALFKQSLDIRSSDKFLRKKLPRVYFGADWLRDSAAELWRNDIMRFPLLVTSDTLQSSKEELSAGRIPDLRGIRLHNGTTYTWNRMCYGMSGSKPHLRIECRYLPAGPSVIDEISNFAFWIGLMKCEPPGGKEFWKEASFKEAKGNFLRAASSGLNSIFQWYGRNISAKSLILDELLPMSQKGLERCNVDSNDIKKYLGVIQKRVEGEMTGSDWIVARFRKLSKTSRSALALKQLVAESIAFQKENVPVHLWTKTNGISDFHQNVLPTVEHIMTSDIITAHEEDSVELIKSMFEWNDFHHLPVENFSGDLIGLITDGIVKRLEGHASKGQVAKEIMIKNPIVLQANESLQSARIKMDEKSLSGVPVVYNNKLIGILTRSDLDQSAKSISSSH